MVLLSSGPGEEPSDVRRARGGGGPQGADQGADRAQHSAGAGEQPPENPGQPGADGSVPGAGTNRRLSEQRRPAASPPGKLAGPPVHTELWHIGVTRKLYTGKAH